MSTPNPYTVLGVDPDADADTIKRAYRSLVREWHPDVNGDPQAVGRTVELNAAYEILSDPELRASYDRGGFDLASWIEAWLHRQETCMRCGKDMLEGRRYGYRRRDTLYCSNACRQAAYRQRKREERERERENRERLDRI